MSAGYTRIDLGREYSSGINAPAGPADAGKLTVVNPAGLNLSYQTAASVIDPLPLSSRYIHLEDSFCSGNTNSGNIGALGWSATATGASMSLSRPLSGSTTTAVGGYSIGAGSAGAARLHLGTSAGNTLINATMVRALRWIVNVTATADLRLRIGLCTTWTSAPSGQNSAIFEANANANANWQLVSDNGSGAPEQTSGPAIATGEVCLDLVNDGAGTWRFYVGGALAATHATKVPTSAVHPGAGIEDLSTGGKSFLVQYCYLTSHPFTGPRATPLTLA